MNVSELEKKYSELLKDDNFDLLSLKLNEPNIFKVLGIQNYEIRHSNFLSWLLDPNETHGLGDFFLLRFLQDIFLDDRAKGVSVIQLPKIDNKKVEVRREWENIDVLVITEDFVVCIENKIWSNEHSDQLKRYKQIVEENFPARVQVFVFLSPYGDEASMNQDYVNYSYDRIIEILESLLSRASLQRSQTIETYIKDYLTILKQNLMANDDVNSLAEELYKNHQELFDFVFQNKPDHRSFFTERFNSFIRKNGWFEGSRNKNYFRFTTPKLAEKLVPYETRNGGWKNKEPLLFELILWSEKYVYFQVAIAPGKWQKSLRNIIEAESGESKDDGKTWYAYMGKTLYFNYDTLNDLFSAEFEQEMNNFFEEIKGEVDRVEQLLLNADIKE